MSIIINVFLSILMMALTLVSIYIPGIVLAHLIIPEKDKKQYFWILAPFLGISISILVLQSLVYLDIPLSISVFPYFLIAIISAGYIFFKHRNDIPEIPRTLFLLSLVVLSIQGAGFFVLGANNYIGYGWGDQYNYVTLGQFLMDKPFSMELNEIGNEPYLVTPLYFKNDRIGQSVLNGFVGVLGQVNAKTAYGPVSLLSPFLTFLAAWMISCRIINGKWKQYGAALAASLIPGFAMIHLMGFFCHSLAIPFLLLWPLIIENALETKGWRNIVIGILVLSAVHAIYADFSLIFIILALSAWVWHLLQKGNIIQSSQSIFLILAGGILVNVGYIEKSIFAIVRGVAPNALQSIYPYAYKVEGLGYLWFGYSGPLLGSKWLIFGVNFVSVLLTLLAFAGLINNFRKQKNIFSLLILILAIFPLGIISQLEPIQFQYQFFKMLRTVSPLLVIGLWSVMTDFWSDNSKDDSVNNTNKKSSYKAVQLLPVFILICLLLSSILATSYLASLSIGSIGKNRSNVMMVNTQELLETYSYLESEKDKDFIVSASNSNQLGWIAYHGRNNRIFFFKNEIGGFQLDTSPETFSFDNQSKFPSTISSETFSFNDPSKFPSSAKKIIVGEQYPKIIPLSSNEDLMAMIHIHSIESPGYTIKDFNLMGEEMSLLIYSQAKLEMNITLNFDVSPDALDPIKQHIIELNVEKGKSQEPVRIEFENKKTISTPYIISPGLNIIKFQTIFPEQTKSISPNGPSEFLVNISKMKIIVENNSLR